MENNYLIEKGFGAYERKKEKTHSLLSVLLILFIILSFVSLSTVLVLQRENKAFKEQLQQRDNLIKALTATNNELVNDNLNLSK